MLHVPYKSSPPAVQDVLSGRVSMMFTDMATGLPHAPSGALRALATTRLQAQRAGARTADDGRGRRHGFRHGSWAGFVAPANTPPDIVTRLNTELRKIIDSPEVKAQIAATGFEAFLQLAARNWRTFIKVQLGKWDKMIKDAGIQPE